MSKKEKSVIPAFRIPEHKSNLPRLLRMVFSASATRLDFGYLASKLYRRGGWINIFPETFLQDQSTGKKYMLKDALDIPLAPDHFDFESRHDWRVFSLIFEPVPQKSCVLRMVEEEPGNHDSFNYSDLEIDFSNSMELYPQDISDKF